MKILYFDEGEKLRKRLIYKLLFIIISHIHKPLSLYFRIIFTKYILDSIKIKNL